jgi:CRISPR-associated protein Cas1
MAVLYVTDQGAYIAKRGTKLIVMKGKEQLYSVHAFTIDQIVLMGNITLSSGAVAFILSEGIDTVYMSVHGKYRGRLISHLGKNIELRCLQFEKMAREEKKLALAKLFVYGKLSNCRVLLRRHNLTLKNHDITYVLHKLRTMSRRITEAESLSTLLGIEGKSGNDYFSVFGKLLKAPDITFTGRNRRPPKDPVNVLLSLGYTLLENVIQTQVNITGLDPYLGCYHSVEYGRASLVLDLIEEFRPVLVDSLVIQLINKRIIKSTDFYRPEDREPAAFDFAETETTRTDLPILITHVGMKKFITHFEARINQKVFYEPTGKQLKYKDVCLEQVRKLVRNLKEEEEYKPYIMK